MQETLTQLRKPDMKKTLVLVLSFAFISQGFAQTPRPSTATPETLSTEAQASNALLAQELEALPEGIAVQISQVDSPAIYRFFQERITSNQPSTLSTTSSAACCDGGNSLDVATTKHGTLVILDRGDGVVHLLAYTANSENPDMGNLDRPALVASITESGIDLVLVDEDQLALFLEDDQTNVVVQPQAKSTTNAPSRFDLIAQELETMPDGVEVQVTPDTFPRVYEFFQAMTANKGATGFSTVDIGPTSSAVGSLNLIETRKGFIGVLDRGDGTVHLIVQATNLEDPGVAENVMVNGPALVANITANGIDVLSINQDQLAQFVGTNQLNTLAGAEGTTTVPSTSPNSTADIALKCSDFTTNGVCCVVASDTLHKICFCCATISPFRLGCTCAKL